MKTPVNGIGNSKVWPIVTLVSPKTSKVGRSPRTKNQEPRTKNQEPRTKNQEPRTKNQEPRTLTVSAAARLYARITQKFTAFCWTAEHRNERRKNVSGKNCAHRHFAGSKNAV